MFNAMEEQAAKRPPGTHVLAKPAGPICNLNCRYCYYLEKESLYPSRATLPDWTLSGNALEEFVRQYIQSDPSPVISFAWQGGEPTLLGVDYFRKVMELERKYADGKTIENTMQTNGLLLDDAWAEFLSANRFLVGLSIDGPRAIHDAGRVDKGGAPSFDKVMRGWGFLKKHGVEFNTLTVVYSNNSRRPLEVYRFLKEIGSGFMQFIPVVERVRDGTAPGVQAFLSPHSSAPSRVSEWSVEPAQYGNFLCAIFDEWVRHDVGKSFVQLFDVTLEAWMGMEPSLCVFRRTCGTAAVIEHNGDIYSCDHYVYPEDRLGNILQQPLDRMLGSGQQIRFGRDKLDRLPGYCLKCDVRFACNGECPKHRFAKAPDGEGNLNYLCPAYKLFFSHVRPHMDFMAGELRAERPPANVMEWIRGGPRRDAASRKPGRNDPCPCGSGLKYKRCCGKA